MTRTNSNYFKKKELKVTRRFSDFLGLHDKLAEKYRQNGRIIPPAPDKSVVGMTKVKISKDGDEHQDEVSTKIGVEKSGLKKIGVEKIGVKKYRQNGRIIPPAPDKSITGMTKLKISKDGDKLKTLGLLKSGLKNKGRKIKVEQLG